MWDMARRCYENAEELAAASGSADHFLYFGTVLVEVYAEYAPAYRAYLKSLELNPNNYELHARLVELYSHSSMSTDATANKRGQSKLASPIQSWRAFESYRAAKRLVLARVGLAPDPM